MDQGGFRTGKILKVDGSIPFYFDIIQLKGKNIFQVINLKKRIRTKKINESNNIK